MKSPEKEPPKYNEYVQEFVRLVFEESTDSEQLVNLIQKVGINAVFPAQVLWKDDGGKVHESDLRGETFLTLALFYKNEYVLRILLENGADPNQRDGDECPPIWDLQYEWDDPEFGLRATKMLLDYGADPNIVWENEGFYYYVDTKPADWVDSDQEWDYLQTLCDLLEEYGGEF